MSNDSKMTVAKLMAQLRRFPRDAEIVDLDVSVLIDPEANLVQSLTLWDDDGEDEDEPDDPERDALPEDHDRNVVNLSPGRIRS